MSLKVNSASGSKWDAALRKSFRPETPTENLGQIHKGGKFHFSEPLSWATCIGSICILVLAILSADWSSLRKVSSPGVALDMGEFSNLMRTWAGATMKGLSGEFAVGDES